MAASRKPKKGPRSGPKAVKPVTHEAYTQAIFRLARGAKSATEADRAIMARVKLAWGDGEPGTLGITRFNRWKGPDGGLSHWCAVCATAHPSAPHLIAETVLHELGHAVAGPLAGHGDDWRAACARLGLIDAKATYSHGDRPTFAPWVLTQLARIPEPSEGLLLPKASVPGILPGLPIPVATPPIRPCGAGKGTKGGTSYGATRQLLHICGCTPPRRIRAATSLKPLRALCQDCGQVFARVG